MTNLKDIINLSEITGDVVAVGVSGGADSLALLLLMDELLRPLGRRVAALTVDHGLRKESRAEAEYVAGVAAARGMRLAAVQRAKTAPGSDQVSRAKPHHSMSSPR